MTKFSELMEKVQGTSTYQEEKIKADIAHQILIWLNESNSSQKDLANAMQVKPSYLNRIIMASENLSIKSLVKVANAINKKVLISFCERDESVTSSEYKKDLLDSFARTHKKNTAQQFRLNQIDWPGDAANNESFDITDIANPETLIA